MAIRTVWSVGDTVYYPNFLDPSSGRTMTILDREILQYRRSGKIFIRYLCDGLLDRLAEDVRYNVEREYDNLIVIDGKEGSGKSNLAVALCRAIEPEWDMESGYIYNYNEFVQAITGEGDDRERVFLLDEGSLVANKRESMSEDSKRFIELLETMRSRGWTLVMCIPSADRLDVYIRDHRMRYLLHAREMAWDVVNKTPSRGYFELCFKSGDKMETFKTFAYGKCDKMSPEDKKVYDKLKKESQRRLMDKIAGKDKQKPSATISKQASRLQNAAGKFQEMGMTVEDIAVAMDCPYDAVKDYLKAYRREKRNRDDEDQ